MLVFCDGFDHYATTHMATKWDAVASCTIGSTYARTGGQGVFVQGNMMKIVPNQATYIIGCAIDMQALPGGSAITLFTFYDNNTIQVDVRLNPNGTLTVTRNGTTLGSTTNSLAALQYVYLEFKAKIDPTVGTADIRVNGVSWLSLTGLNTRTTANSFANQIKISATNPFAWVDDVYICDNTGTYNNDFLGDVKIQAIYPNAAGAFTQWTKTGAPATNFGCVNETTPDEDTTYVTDGTVGDRDSYKFQSVTLTGTVFAAVVWSRVRKDDAGSRSISLTARSNGTDLFSSVYSISATYAYYSFVLETDPNTSLPWTVTGLNAAEFGNKVVS